MDNCYSHLTCAALSDQGRKRKNNEDAFGVYPQHGVFCVADGMGGAEDGEVASQATVAAVAAMLQQFSAEPPLAMEAKKAWLARAINEASAWIFNRSEERGSRGTGTTFVGVCCDPEYPDSMLAVHAGDSRAYRIRKRDILQITGDHSAAALAGVRDEKELNPMFRGMVMRAVGVQNKVELELTPFEVTEGDCILLCSDGLTRMVKDKVICGIIRKAKNIEAAAQSLIDEANKNGGVDNVTVVLIGIGTLPAPVMAFSPECPVANKPDNGSDKEANTHNTSENDSNTDNTLNFVRCTLTPHTPSTDLSQRGGGLPQPKTDDTAESAERPRVPAEPTPKPEPVKEDARPAKNNRRKYLGFAGAAVGLLACAVAFMSQGYRPEKGQPVTQRALVSNVPVAKQDGGQQPKGQHVLAATESEKAGQARSAEEQRKRQEETARQAEADRLAREKADKEKAEQARVAEEQRKRQEETARQAEADRLAREKAEREKAEQARVAEEQRKRQAEADRLAEAARLALEKADRQRGDPVERLVQLAREGVVLEDFVAVLSEYDENNAKVFRNTLSACAKNLAALADEKIKQHRRPVSRALFSEPADKQAVQKFVEALANVAASIQPAADEWNTRVQMLERNPRYLNEAKEAKEAYEAWQTFIDKCAGSRVLANTETQLALVALARESSDKIRKLREVWNGANAAR